MESSQLVIWGILVVGILVVVYVLRYKYSIGERTHTGIAKYVRQHTDADTLAAFICSNDKAGNVGLLFKKDSIVCANSDQTVFQISPSQLSLVEYSDHNFFRFHVDGKPIKISYLHDPSVGESLVNNIIFASTPNLAWTDKKATNSLVAVLDVLDIQHAKVSHSRVVFFPYQGSRSTLILLIVILLVTLVIFTVF